MQSGFILGKSSASETAVSLNSSEGSNVLGERNHGQFR